MTSAVVPTAARAADTVVSLTPTADTFVHASNKTTNYGKSGSLSTYGTPDVETYLAFSLPAAPSGQTLTAVSLRIKTTSISSAGSTDSELVHFVTSSWNETTVTWNTKPTLGTATLGTLVAPNAINTPFTFSLDAAAIGTKLGTSTSIGIVGNGKDGLFFNSREASATAARPLLSLTFSPSAPPTDTTPPDPPSEVDSTVNGHNVSLEWTPSNDDVGTVGYDVYRSATSGFTPDSSTFIGSVTSTSYEDDNRPAGNWYYVVTARDAAGNVSAPSVQEQATVTDPPPPDVTLTVTPTEDTYVHGVNKTTNYGKESSLAAYGSPDLESFLRFNVPAAPAGEQFSAASLRLTTTGISAAGSTNSEQIKVASNSWSETTTTWNTKPSVGALIGTLPPTTVSSTSYDISLDHDAIAGMVGTTASLAVLGTGTDGFWFSSREVSNAALRPRLTLQFVSGPPDTSPPSQPTNLAAAVNTNRVTLDWTDATDDVGVTRYDVYRSTDSSFMPSPGTQIGDTATSTYEDSAPATGTYYYRVVARDAAQNSSFPSDPATAVVDTMPTVVQVAAFGDSACPPGYTTTATTCRQSDVAAVVNAADPNYVIALGDLQYSNGTYGQFTGSWDVTWGPLKSRTLPAPGNHEFADPSTPASGYFDYWLGQGVNSGTFGDRGVGAYTTMLGTWRLIVLNSECTSDIANGNHPMAGGCDVGSPEYQWLSGVLTQNTAQCTLVAFHRARWSTGPHGPYAAMAPMWDLMASNGVDVVLSGHDHDTEVWKPIGVSGSTTTAPVQSSTGIREFVVGTGGKDLSLFPSSPASGLMAATQARDQSTFGALMLTLKDGTYDWAYAPVAGQSYTNVGTSGAFSGSNVSCN